MYTCVHIWFLLQNDALGHICLMRCGVCKDGSISNYTNETQITIDLLGCNYLTHWGRVTHICVSKLTIIGSDNGLSPDRRQAIIWTNAGLLLIGPLGTNFSEILIEILTFSFKKMRLKVSSAKRRPFCIGLKQFLNSVLLYLISASRGDSSCPWHPNHVVLCHPYIYEQAYR